jgi:hypothetical protein
MKPKRLGAYLKLFIVRLIVKAEIGTKTDI